MRTVLILVAGLWGCGEAQAPVRAPGAPVATATQAQPIDAPVQAAAGGALTRTAVRSVVSQGLGAFLAHVEVDDHPVVVDGKFRGFRIVALRGERFWSGVDLRPGDVVTSINGLPIERPEQAQTAFDSLAVSSELRVAYDRDGKPRELVYPIVDR